MKDVLVFVMEEMAKESETDFKFQMPKHTSFVGTIVKSVGIEAVSRNPVYIQYIAQLTNSSGKYLFDTDNETFRNIYRDTVLLLAEKGFLFEDDPEFMNVRRQMKNDGQVDGHLEQSVPLQPIAIGPDDIIQPMPSGGYPPMGAKPREASSPDDDDESDVTALLGGYA